MGIIKSFVFTLLIVFFYLYFNPYVIQAKQGCCSHHGGVSGCDTSVGRYVCNDGTYSPSCGCSYIPKKVIPTKIPTLKPISTPIVIPTKSVAYYITPVPPRSDTDSLYPWLSGGFVIALGVFIFKMKDKLMKK